MVDIRRGGQFGWHHDMKGIVNATPYVSNNLICKVLSSPRGFNDLPEHSEIWHGSFKALFELHPLTIDGLNSTISVNWAEAAFGGTGEMIEAPSGATRERSTVSMTFNEKYGLPITHMLEQYQRLFIMDEETKHPGISLLVDNVGDGLLDYYTWTMIFIEPDRYMERAIRTWLVANMAPKTMPEKTGKRDKNSDQDLLEISVDFTGVTQIGYAVDKLGDNIIKSMRQTHADPLRAPAYLNGVTGDIADREFGFIENMERAAREMVQPD